MAADYAYNLIHNNPNTEERLKLEKGPLVRSYEKNQNNVSIEALDKLKANNANDSFVGKYENKDNWPDIIISKDSFGYQIKWGILTGSIYTEIKGKKPFIASFNVLSRSLDIKKNKLTIGSLKYKKVNTKN